MASIPNYLYETFPFIICGVVLVFSFYLVFYKPVPATMDLFFSTLLPVPSTLDLVQVDEESEEESEEEIEEESEEESEEAYEPSIDDILDVKNILITKIKLPLEIVDVVIDFAEYWAHSTTSIARPTRVESGDRSENRLLLRSFPLGYTPRAGQTYSIASPDYTSIPPKHTPPGIDIPNDAIQEVLDQWKGDSRALIEPACRKVVFTIESHDQGWGPRDAGPYHGSFTWFDFGLERVSATRQKQVSQDQDPLAQFTLATDDPILCNLETIIPKTIPSQEWGPKSYELDHPLNPSDNTLQKNVAARGTTKKNIITWTREDDMMPASPEAMALEQLGRGRATGTGEFVRNLKIGDVVTVWGKARFPRWVNFVEKLKIDVYWVV